MSLWTTVDYETFTSTRFSESFLISGAVLKVLQQICHGFGGRSISDGYRLTN